MEELFEEDELIGIESFCEDGGGLSEDFFGGFYSLYVEDFTLAYEAVEPVGSYFISFEEDVAQFVLECYGLELLVGYSFDDVHYGRSPADTACDIELVPSGA